MIRPQGGKYMKKITEAMSAALGAVCSFFTGLPPVIWVLVAVMSLDYVTGLMCGAMGKSPQDRNRGPVQRHGL